MRKRFPKVLRVNSPRRSEDDARIRQPVENMTGEVYIQEKLDGANARFQLDGDELKYGSKTQTWDKIEEASPQFREAFQEIKDSVYIEELLRIENLYDSKLCFFLENMVLHNIDYDWENTPRVVGFDIWSYEQDEFLHPKQSEQIFDRLGLDFVPHYEVTEASSIEDIKNYEIPDSNFGDGKAEGVVIKNPETGIYAKLHRDDFKEHNSLSFGHAKSRAEDPAERVAAEFCTNQRIIKTLQKQVIEHGRELTMEDMMGDANVHILVLEDIWEEEFPAIIHKNWEVDMRKLKKLVTDRVRKVLRRRINVKERNNLSDQEALAVKW